MTTGLNDYRYVASLYIDHPTVDPDAITRGMPIKPDRICRIGDPKRTPREGFYDRTHWSVKLQTPADGDVAEFLSMVFERLDSSRALLTELADTGGRAEIFIGLFADRCCDFEMPPTLLANLASLSLGLRLDYYGPDRSPPTP
ncbi:DUF4279 domain-containing protein [Rubripirellula lacrimiformis]|uniref:DUF4279 domain-containing protein n=1 Tax=Rubripirellula lacrimiformis TaxID=1930273 RepID=UPI003704A7E3